RVEQHLVVRVNDGEDVALADVTPRRATDVDLPAATLDRDGADVLRRRLRAVPRASRRRELELRRRLDPLIPPLDLHAERRAVADAVAAELRTDARLAGAERLGVGVPRRHPELAP